ncbi:heavy metal-binding protein HIP-like [Pecten maximus]|uniref:heavy metal-binding protein HIP-like n=1 Tax=Pecten maximus TaxID=6579 RepID=UPI00145828A9|nr:heavy metal-binding protein HIP-like [Pecten maximus]
MAYSVKRAVTWTIFVLCYRQLVAADTTVTLIADLEKLAAKVELSVYTNTNQLDKLHLRVRELQDDTRADQGKVRRAADPNIGLDALVVDVNTNLGDQQAILFDNVQTNQGSGYNPASGKFTCPKSGSISLHQPSRPN